MIYYCDADLRVINGGGKVFIEHVYFLNKHGMNAKLVCSHPLNWWFCDVVPFTVPREEFLERLDRKKDIIVFTGPWSYPWTTLLSDKTVYLIQGFRDNFYYLRDPYYKLDQMIMKDRRIHKIAVSKSIAEYHFDNNGLNMAVMNNGIMLEKYIGGEQEKTNRIFCHARKGTKKALVFKEHFQSHELSKHFDLCFVEKKNFLSLSDTIKNYRISKYFFDFSPLDGFALMPLEAMACGCIVFCLNNGGNQEYLKHGVNGFSYEKDREELIPDMLGRILQIEKDACLYDRIRTNALKTAQRFSWQEKIQPYLKFYKDLN